jgi:DNA-binding SARP family transcriptional activator
MASDEVVPARFTLLNSLSLTVGGSPVALGGHRQRSVLLLLLLAQRQAVGTERIVDAVWGGTPPPSATASLHVYVARLRKLLGPARDWIQTGGQGYRLVAPVAAVDAWRFDEALDRALSAAAAGRPRQVQELLGPILREWSEPRVFGSMRDESWAVLYADRLEERRIVAIETLAEAELALDQPASALLRLEDVAPQNPHREGLARTLMLALYRSGRQAEALAVFDRCRRSLRSELGIEPSQALRRTQRAILVQAPELSRPVSVGG